MHSDYISKQQKYSDNLYYIPPRAEAAFYLLWKYQKIYELEELFIRIFFQEIKVWVAKVSTNFETKKWVMSKEDITQSLYCNILYHIRKRKISHPHKLLAKAIQMTKVEIISQNDNLRELLDSILLLHGPLSSSLFSSYR